MAASGHHLPMDDPRTAEGIEHLQAAARELVAAARSFLDVVEQVVDDDDRFSGAASSFADLLGRGIGSATGKDLAGGLLTGLAGREPAWLRNDPDHPDAPHDPDDLWFAPDPTEPTAEPAEPAEPEPAAGTSGSTAPPAKRAAPKRAASSKAASSKAASGTAASATAEPRTRRVKRIAVD